MTPLNKKYTGILWTNVLFLAGGIAGMIYYKWHNVLYAAGAGLSIGTIEYLYMRMSLGKKQQKEDEKNKQ